VTVWIFVAGIKITKKNPLFINSPTHFFDTYKGTGGERVNTVPDNNLYYTNGSAEINVPKYQLQPCASDSK